MGRTERRLRAEFERDKAVIILSAFEKLVKRGKATYIQLQRCDLEQMARMLDEDRKKNMEAMRKHETD